MKVVVADSSPLIVLVNMGHISIWPALFERVIIPLAVANNHQIADLHAGETEALNLATELAADFLLVDECKAFHEALARHVNAIGTVRVLEMAAEGGLLDLCDAFDRLLKTDFWVSRALLDARLKLFHHKPS